MELWRDIPGSLTHEFSNWGRIRSKKSVLIKQQRRLKGITGHDKILETEKNHYRVVLYKQEKVIFDYYFLSMEEAIRARDSFLDSL